MRRAAAALVLAGGSALAAAPAIAGPAPAAAARGILAVRHADADNPRELFAFADGRITEASGLAVSARHKDVVYVHNDSGGGPQVFAVGPDGRTRAVLTLRGARARDWEALAPGRSASGAPVLWVGDIGDNLDAWEEIAVYRVAEPRQLRSQDVSWARYRLRYADGSRNAESLLVDPSTQRLYVVSKRAGDAAVYAAPQRLRTDRVNVLRRVAAAPDTVTDGAFLPGGRQVVLRSYFTADVYDRRWRRISSLGLPLQPVGEALAASPDGRSVLTTSEGQGAAVWRVPLPRSVPAAPLSPGAPPSRTPAPRDQERGGLPTKGAGVAVIALTAGAVAAWALRRR